MARGNNQSKAVARGQGVSCPYEPPTPMAGGFWLAEFVEDSQEAEDEKEFEGGHLGWGGFSGHG